MYAWENNCIDDVTTIPHIDTIYSADIKWSPDIVYIKIFLLVCSVFIIQ